MPAAALGAYQCVTCVDLAPPHFGLSPSARRTRPLSQTCLLSCVPGTPIFFAKVPPNALLYREYAFDASNAFLCISCTVVWLMCLSRGLPLPVDIVMAYSGD